MRMFEKGVTNWMSYSEMMKLEAEKKAKNDKKTTAKMKTVKGKKTKDDQ